MLGKHLDVCRNFRFAAPFGSGSDNCARARRIAFFYYAAQARAFRLVRYPLADADKINHRKEHKQMPRKINLSADPCALCAVRFFNNLNHYFLPGLNIRTDMRIFLFRQHGSPGKLLILLVADV